MPAEAIDERTRRVADAAAQAGADWALLCSPEGVCYATGYAVPIETGPLPFQGGPPLALVARDAMCGLLVTNLETAAASASRADVVRAYEGFSAVRQPAWRDEYLRAVRGLVDTIGASGTLALEPGAVPFALADTLRSSFSGFVDIDPWLTHARAEKTPLELGQLRRAAQIASVGQREAQSATVAGRTELEAFAQIRVAIELAEGGRVPMQGDYISGIERTAACEGWPSDRTMLPGDPVIVDLSPRCAGYWGDSCNTLVIGEPSAALRAVHAVARRAIEQARESVRPGVSAGSVAREVAAVIEQSGFANPLHIGHGTGTGFHEFPRIVAEERATLRPGMVLMIEPGAYHPDHGGVRLEHMFEVTETGNQLLTDFELRMGD